MSDWEVFTRNMLQSYINTIIKKPDVELLSHYWDAIVLTAADKCQASFFDSIIKIKRSNNFLPQIPIHVFEDESLPDKNIGTGGATLKALNKLEIIYGAEKLFDNMKIMMIHCGGYSQRLPSHTLTGKIFMPLPIDLTPEYAFDLFDFKLALYVPLLPILFKSSGGVFITSADDALIYQITVFDTTEYHENLDFVCLAHPSPIETGEKHGVFILGPPIQNDIKNQTKGCDKATHEMQTLIRVLQKPDFKTMKETGAIFYDPSAKNTDDILKGSVVYTDSSFLIRPRILKMLLNYFKLDLDEKIDEEIDCYIDFLHPLGVSAHQNYPDLRDSSLKSPRIDLYHLLKDSSVDVFVLKRSKFYHMGTLPELVHEYCSSNTDNNSLGYYLKFSRLFNSSITHIQPLECIADEISQHGSRIMHSIVRGIDYTNLNDPTSNNSVIEYCEIDLFKSGPLLKIHPQTIISHCVIDLPWLCRFKPSVARNVVNIPAGTFWYTCPFLYSNHERGEEKTVFFATFCIGLYDDIKRPAVILDANQASEYFSLNYIGKRLNLPCDDLISVGNLNLWRAKIFALRPSAQESFWHTLEFVENYLTLENGKCIPDYDNRNYVSLSDLSNQRKTCLPLLLERRKCLLEKLKNLPK